jgi:very-short-patch-repair endonuclease
MTDAERKLWRALRGWRQGHAHFRRQATVGPYFADFACHSNRIVIELDGGQHGEPAHAARDRARDAYFADNGYQVLRFWNNDVMTNIEGVLDRIADAIGRSSPPTPDPFPPLRGGRGTQASRRVAR